MSRFSVENFLSDSAEKFRRGTLLCCVSGSQKFMEKRRGVEYQELLSKFLSNSAENFVGKPFCDVFQKISGSEKIYG